MKGESAHITRLFWVQNHCTACHILKWAQEQELSTETSSATAMIN